MFKPHMDSLLHLGEAEANSLAFRKKVVILFDGNESNFVLLRKVTSFAKQYRISHNRDDIYRQA